MPCPWSDDGCPDLETKHLHGVAFHFRSSVLSPHCHFVIIQLALPILAVQFIISVNFSKQFVQENGYSLIVPTENSDPCTDTIIENALRGVSLYQRDSNTPTLFVAMCPTTNRVTK